LTSSTPVKAKRSELSPSEFEPPAKRLHGEGCKKRQDILQSQLKEDFVESPGKRTERSEVMSFLETDSKSLATRAVKSAFPSATYDKRKQQYRNIRKSISFVVGSESSDESDLQVSQNTEIYNLQQNVLTRKQKAKLIMDDILSNSSVSDNVYLRTLVNMYNQEMESISKITDSIDAIYERELKLLLQRETDKKISASERSTIVLEYDRLSTLVNLGIRSGVNSPEEQVTGETFRNLKLDFVRECPMLTEIVQCLFPDTEMTDRKSKCAVHALSLLTSLRNRHCKNDVTLLFTMMLVSYGAGCRMINILNKCGLTIHWDTLMNYLDSQLERKKKYVTSLTPQEIPLLLLIDNVNIYRGNKRHHRLYKAYGDNMWNFTVRGLLVPHLEGIQDLLSSRETAAESQHDVKDFNFEDIALDSNVEHCAIWTAHVDNYLTKLLQDGLNFSTEKPLKEMSENECNRCLSTKSYSTSTDLKISADSSYVDISQSSRKSNTTILPLSLENNSTLAGTCAILDQFGKEFSIPSSCQSEKLHFDKHSKTFCLKQAREHAEFIMMMNHHLQDSEQYKLLSSNAEENDADTFNCGDGFGDLEDQEVAGDVNCQKENEETPADTTVSSVKKLFQSQDILFNSTYESLKNKMCEAFQTDTIERFVKEMAEKPYVRDMKDHLGRTFLHIAVEQLNMNFVECLLHVGFNPNAKEKCGITPIIISVVLKSKEMCQLLVKSRACVRGPLFTNVPSPMAVAKKMELAEILEILDPTSSDEEDDDLCSYDPAFQSVQSQVSVPTTKDNNKACTRSSPGFITGVVGDVGTCKTNRGVMSRSSSHDWVGIIPGDMHTKGYLAEACFKEQGPGGFHYLVHKVLKRPKLTKEAFKKKKFAEGNLSRIREAVRDGARAYGLAAVMEFKESQLYPDPHMLSQCNRATGSHTEILLGQFKLWVKQSNVVSSSFKYRSRMFLYYGPLFELYDLATNHCWGLARETCFLHQLPMYAQLNFPNYFTECFIHTVNLLGKWSLAFRKTVGLNCSVNVTGRQGCGLELDAFVEAEIVQPLKTYVSGTVSIWLIRQDYSMFAFYFIPVRYCRSNCLIFLMFSTCTIHFVQVQNILLLT
jgi:hypothetical protein